MNILIVANCNTGHFAPFVVEQVEAIKSYGVNVEYFGVIGKGIKGYLKNIRKLKAKIKEFKPDVIHAHYGLCGLLANIQRSTPVVTTYHGSDINIPSVRRFSEIAICLSKFNIFVSEKTKNLIKSRSNSELIPCGINLNLYGNLSRSIVRTKYHFPETEQIVLFAGDFDNQVKNSKLAKEAVLLLPKVRLIELKGYTRLQVIELMYASDVFLMTSFTEGSPQVIKEAMACCRPIVSTDVGDVKWVVGDTNGCYICFYDPRDCADKIKQALEFSENNTQTNGRNRIEDLGLDNKIVAKKIIEIYNNVIE
ncbi:glycosyltransferase [Bacteroides sp.]|uniref:glycosyltransferase n=1 Tax=Bacteroides sp. TaxID=29523 RepID=UPI00261F6892|nr:glycosyltransferase [Bacteroides sp.]MDD3038752.1 glycosyltransferase [Bacteroides sp.]